MKLQTTQKPLAVFSYSSLTDIVLLLLIFFLLTSQFVIQTGVKVKLPSSQLNEQSIPTKYVVSITSEGSLYLGQKQVSIDALPGELSKLQEGTQEKNLVIRADQITPIDLVIKVIDAAKAVGIDKFTIETEKAKL